MALANTDEVLAALDEIVARAKREGDRVGYFATLYRAVTARVKEGIETGFFDDGPRMEKLDAVFANRYLDALVAHERGDRPTRSWEVTFDAAARWRPIVLQHLLVAINAHINLDLGIAAARVAPGNSLRALRRDFDRINEILASMVGGVRRNVGDVSPWIGLLDRIGGARKEVVINFSVRVARREAWRFATQLASLPEDRQAPLIRVRDKEVAALADRVLHPGVLSSGLTLIRLREGMNVPDTIRALSRFDPPELEVVEARVEDPQAR